MTKEFVLERVGVLLDALPGGDNIRTVCIAERDPYEKQELGECYASAHLKDDVDIYAIASKLGIAVQVESTIDQKFDALKIVDPQHRFDAFQLVHKPGCE